MKFKFELFHLEKAIADMLVILRSTATSDQIDKLIADHECIAEIDEHGVAGPVGLGIGVYGGHAVD